MVLIVCVDDRNGMMFHKRRQSQDRILRKRILERAGGQRIWMSQDTAKQFEGEKQAVIRTDEHFFQKAVLWKTRRLLRGMKQLKKSYAIIGIGHTREMLIFRSSWPLGSGLHGKRLPDIPMKK